MCIFGTLREVCKCVKLLETYCDPLWCDDCVIHMQEYLCTQILCYAICDVCNVSMLCCFATCCFFSNASCCELLCCVVWFLALFFLLQIVVSLFLKRFDEIFALLPPTALWIYMYTCLPVQQDLLRCFHFLFFDTVPQWVLSVGYLIWVP